MATARGRYKSHSSAFKRAVVEATLLRAVNTGLTPERALEQLQRIQHHRVRLNGRDPVAGVSSISTEQNGVFNALGIAKPAVPEQFTLL